MRDVDPQSRWRRFQCRRLTSRARRHRLVRRELVELAEKRLSPATLTRRSVKCGTRSARR
jgi:hypothetical protein